MLNKDSILAAIPNFLDERIHQLMVYEQIGSTNDMLLESPIYTDKACVCIAEHQLNGRGRRGNKWNSDDGSNLTMSISWGFPTWPETITGLSLAVGMTIASRLNSEFDLDVKLKWPNDLYIADKKLGGILIEMNGVADGACQVVVGIGINLQQSDQSEFASDYRWTSLSEQEVHCNRNQLAGQLIGDITEMLIGFYDRGFEPLVSLWGEMCAFSNQPIKVLLDNETINGRVQGVDMFGALIIENQQGEMQTIADSTASIRLLSAP